MWFANLLLFSLEHSVCNVIWMIVCILLLLHMRESVAELQNFCFKCCSGSRTLLSMFLLTEASNIFTVIFCLVNQFYAWTFFQGEWWHHPIHLWVIVLDLWKRNIHLLSNILSQVTYVEGTFSSNIHNTQSPPNLLLHCETTVINIHRIALSRPSVSSSSTCYNCSPSSYFNCCFHTLIPKTFSCSCSWSHFLQLEVAIFIFLFLPILMTQFVHSSAKLFLYNYLVDDASGVITMERCRLGCKSSFSLSPLISLCFVVCYTEKDGWISFYEATWVIGKSNYTQWQTKLNILQGARALMWKPICHSQSYLWSLVPCSVRLNQNYFLQPKPLHLLLMLLISWTHHCLRLSKPPSLHQLRHQINLQLIQVVNQPMLQMLLHGSWWWRSVSFIWAITDLAGHHAVFFLYCYLFNLICNHYTMLSWTIWSCVKLTDLY